MSVWNPKFHVLQAGPSWPPRVADFTTPFLAFFKCNLICIVYIGTINWQPHKHATVVYCFNPRQAATLIVVTRWHHLLLLLSGCHLKDVTTLPWNVMLFRPAALHWSLYRATYYVLWHFKKVELLLIWRFLIACVNPSWKHPPYLGCCTVSSVSLLRIREITFMTAYHFVLHPYTSHASFISY